MKITKAVNVDVEVEVGITMDDISAVIAEHDTDRAATVLVGINSCAKFFKAIPDATIIQMNSSQRGVIRKFLFEQSARFYIAEQKIEEKRDA